jgi:exodeoxyribonuclease VII large subunit
MSEAARIYTVSDLTRLIKAALEDAFGELWVAGELSNVRQPASGHCYFTIKDDASQIAAVMFRGDQWALRFQPADGIFVRAFGAISVYERSGNYQIIVRRMEEGGQGSLQARFEALKRRLAEEGLFDEARKRPIPLLPRHIGIVTSRTGAALQDILKILSRRFPNLHVVLAPVRVQGEGAAEDIAAAIDLLNARGGLDVLIVGRGGGSIEDLWCFNEEVVARAIVRSGIPVISAVGHEIDFTISDLVADLRAPTPSAAAELLVERKDTFEERLLALSDRIGRALRQRARDARNRLRAAAGSYVFREPSHLARQHRLRLRDLERRMAHELDGRQREVRQRLDDLGLRMAHAVRLRSQACSQDVKRLDRQLAALSPLAVLSRGFSITRKADGRILRSAGDVAAGDRIVTRLADGSLESDVTGRTAD